VRGVEASWSIHTPDAQTHGYDGLGHGLKGFFDKNEGKAAAAIRYHNKDAQYPPLVGASILMPQAAFNDLLALFRRIIGDANISYVIALESRRSRTVSTCDVGVCGERRQTVCTEPFRLGNAARRRGALRVRSAAVLIANFGGS
jgi:hypothetical protein